MTLEELVNNTNISFFFKEFTYSSNKFSNYNKEELELADYLILVKNQLLIFQVKERNEEEKTVDDSIWLRNIVNKKAKKQIKDTILYLDNYTPIEIENNHKHTMKFNKSNEYKIQKIICFKCESIEKYKKFSLTQDVGVIHYFSFEDYQNIIKSLSTFAEIWEYIEFKEKLFRKYGTEIEDLSESVFIGHYVSNELYAKPHIRYEYYYDKLLKSVDNYDIRHILSIMGDRLEDTRETTSVDYYPILEEFSLLPRSYLRHIKKLFYFIFDAARDSIYRSPKRLLIKQNNCGFVFYSLPKDVATERKKILNNVTMQAKYSLKSTVQIGVSIVYEGEDFLIDWAYINEEHKFNEELEKILKESNIFDDLKFKKFPRYLL